MTVAEQVDIIRDVSPEEVMALLDLASRVDDWMLKPTPMSRRRLYAARDAVAKVRGRG